jgi:hypothetical protein
VPDGQGLEVALLVAQNCPRGQIVQFVAPDKLYQPDGHGNGGAVVLIQYLPAGHDTHGKVEDSTYWPGEQEVHVTEPEKETDPEGQD